MLKTFGHEGQQIMLFFVKDLVVCHNFTTFAVNNSTLLFTMVKGGGLNVKGRTNNNSFNRI